MADNPSFEEAISDAVKGLGLPEDFDGTDLIDADAEDETTESEETEDDQSEEDEGVEEEGEESESEDEESEEEDEQDDDGDADEDTDSKAKEKRYFRIDLSDVPDEVREKVVSELKDKDRYITRQQQEKSALEREVEELRNIIEQALGSEDDEPEFELPSDEDLIARITEEYGLDPEDPFFEMQVKTALPGVKAAAKAEAKQNALEEEVQLLRFEREYTGKLETLENKGGALPISHADFIFWAAQNGFGDDPTDAYYAFMERAQEIVGGESPKTKPKTDPKRKEAKRAAKKAAGTSPRKPSNRTKPAGDKIKSFDDAVKAAIKETNFPS